MNGDPSKCRLLEAAGNEFADHGFEGASIRSICRRAEMNVAAVNYHYGDKDQLYVAAVIEAHRCGKAPLISEDADFEGPPEEQLRKIIRNMATNMVDRNRIDWHEKLMFREMIRPTKASESLVSQEIKPKFSRLFGVLGALCPSADERKLRAIAFSIVGQCIFYKVGRPIAERLVGEEAIAAMDVEFLADHIAGFTLAALGYAPTLGTDVDRTPKEAAR